MNKYFLEIREILFNLLSYFFTTSESKPEEPEFKIVENWSRIVFSSWMESLKKWKKNSYFTISWQLISSTYISKFGWQTVLGPRQPPVSLHPTLWGWLQHAHRPGAPLTVLRPTSAYGPSLNLKEVKCAKQETNWIKYPEGCGTCLHVWTIIPWGRTTGRRQAAPQNHWGSKPTNSNFED